MNTQALEQHTYLPDEVDGVANVLSFIRAHEHKRGRLPSPRYFLAGPEEGDHVELPETVYRVLLQVLQSLQAGKAVTVAPQSQLLTTQQAAEILGVSRPTVVKLIEKGELPAMTPGTRRRMIKLEDVLTCRRRRREAQYRALMETSVDDYGLLEEDAEQVYDDLRRIRAEIAAERAAQPRQD